MDETPRQFVHELRATLLKKFVGRIAVAIVLAEACLRFLNALTWFLVVPVIAVMLKGNTESVLFKNQRVFPWEQLFGSIVEFAGTLIFLFYVNRWMNKPSSRSLAPATDVPPPEGSSSREPEAAVNSSHIVYNLVGEAVDTEPDNADAQTSLNTSKAQKRTASS